MDRNSVGMEEDNESVALPCHGGEDKDTGVKNEEVTISGVRSTYVRIFVTGQVEFHTRCETYCIASEVVGGVYISVA